MRTQVIIALVALGALAAAETAMGQSTATAGYDAQGRLQCVRRQASQTGTTTYDYDLAGNRTAVATTSPGSCPSEAGAPPTPPQFQGAINLTNPSDTVYSQAVDVTAVSALGSSSTPGTLSLVGAMTHGTTGSCGTVSFTATQVTYNAPVVTGSPAVCRVSYALRHSANGAQQTGQITYTITAQQGGGGEDPPLDPPEDCPPHLEYCTIE